MASIAIGDTQPKGFAEGEIMNTLLPLAETRPHPARYSEPLLPVFAKYASGCKRLLDPMAGTGKIFKLRDYGVTADIHAIELEPEWAAWHPETGVGNALFLPYPDDYFDCICVSPAYGNRMADSYAGKPNEVRNTYRYSLGRTLNSFSGAALQWGRPYRELHLKAWEEASRVLCGGGIFVLNIKDHIRNGQRQRVTRFHELALVHCGLHFVAHEHVNCPGQRNGKNGNLRVSYESVLVFKKMKS